MSSAGSRFALALALAVASTLTACGGSTSTGSTDARAATAAVGVTASDAWVKASPEGTTAAFVTLTNSSDSEETLESATTLASQTVEIHEMVMSDGTMVMRPKRGGVTVPAHGTAVLEPGGNHLMLMALTSPIKPGDRVAMTLRFASGTSLEMTAPAKDFAGAQESYQPSSASSMSSPK